MIALFNEKQRDSDNNVGFPKEKNHINPFATNPKEKNQENPKQKKITQPLRDSTKPLKPLTKKEI